MQAGFWHERWESDQLGFHQSEVNPLLAKYWPRLQLPRESAVFVPLCGKSLDLHWLRRAEHTVVGVEISPIAVRDFFAEANLDVVTRDRGAFRSSESGGYSLYCGDFFELEATDLAQVAGCYDRAALIALPPEMRVRYAAHLSSILPKFAKILMIAIEYDTTKMDGPPHSVEESEIRSLFGGDFEVALLDSSGDIAPTQRFRERGLESWCEKTYRLDRRTPGADCAGVVDR